MAEHMYNNLAFRKWRQFFECNCANKQMLSKWLGLIQFDLTKFCIEKDEKVIGQLIHISKLIDQ